MSNYHFQVLISLAFNSLVLFALMAALIQAYPTASVSLFSTANKLDKSLGHNDDLEAEQSFRRFMHSKPESVVIGQFKPNASSFELMLLKNKIADTILGMQEMDKNQNSQAKAPIIPGESIISSASECFIEITRVEKIPGKCSRVAGGLPICQSESYMAINNDCN